ncbi:hypothetical protein V9K97_02210 [Variovorax sp. CCNWLW186]|uniref:hypothetical protein n=1 Tax=Variovorax sp. CCNWLW186 TaxID=3127473 RepID=UPI0030787E7A
MADARKSIAAPVLEAVQDLQAQEQIVTRETLAELIGLKLSVIDDRLGTLTDDGVEDRSNHATSCVRLDEPLVQTSVQLTVTFQHAISCRRRRLPLSEGKKRKKSL